MQHTVNRIHPKHNARGLALWFFRARWRGLIGLLCLSLLSACSGSGSEEQSAAPAMPQMPPSPVDVAQVLYQEINDWAQYTGRLEAKQRVALTPRVSGHIERVAFDEGSYVKEGQLLFQIDARSLETEVQRLKADLARAEAEIGLAQRDLNRASSLKQSNAISQEQVDNRGTQLAKARAEADSIRAALANAELDLSFTQVRAPISGRVSNALVTEGNFVTGGTSVLTHIVATDTMHAYFDVDERTYVKLKGMLQADTQLAVHMSLLDDRTFPHRGVIDFIDNRIDVESGTIRLRAEFANAKQQFTPGMFVRLKLQTSVSYHGILIDERAIATDLNRKYVLVLGENNIVEYRPVEMGPRIGTLRVIRSGLAENERIVVNGLQRSFPGAPVEPTEVPMISQEALGALLLRDAPVEAAAAARG